jgi:hypothetical protein
VFKEDPAEVVDVLGEREACRAHARVDDSVYQAVELLPLPDVDPQDEGCLRGFLDQRRRDDRAECVATAFAQEEVAHYFRGVVDQEGCQGCSAGPPRERQPEQTGWFWFPAIHPQEHCHHRANRKQGSAHSDQLGYQAHSGREVREHTDSAQAQDYQADHRHEHCHPAWCRPSCHGRLLDRHDAEL